MKQIMKQPQLGDYIANLRKEQGLTQEELVEKCNINVRTIQRIEAGDVTPRNYTIKNILQALGSSYAEIINEVPGSFSSKKSHRSNLINPKYAFTIGILGSLLFDIMLVVLLFQTYQESKSKNLP